jgi:hypothetical protein
MTELLARYNDLKREGRTHPLVLIAALVIDFLAIHPVADGNGRVARLLTTYELLSQGYGVARYVSIEQRILESKNTCYDRLYRSQRGCMKVSTTSGPGPLTSRKSWPARTTTSNAASRDQSGHHSTCDQRIARPEADRVERRRPKRALAPLVTARRVPTLATVGGDPK